MGLIVKVGENIYAIDIDIESGSGSDEDEDENDTPLDLYISS